MDSAAFPIEKQTADFQVKGSDWLPRDLLVRAAFGKAYQILLPDSTMLGPSDHGPPVDIVPVYAWLISAQTTFSSQDNSFGGYTSRQLIKAAALANPGGLKTRITLAAPASGNPCNVIACYAGIGATSGDLYDFATTPTQLTFATSTTVSIPVGTSVVSDELNWAPQTGDNLVIATAMSGGSGLPMQHPKTDWQEYYKFGNDAATVNASGYSAYVNAAGVALVETYHLT